MAPAPPRILLCADDAATVDDARHVLEEAGHAITFHALADPDSGEPTSYHLVVVDGGSDGSRALEFCRRLRGRAGESFLPVLYITADPAPGPRLASLECGADTYLLRPFA